MKRLTESRRKWLAARARNASRRRLSQLLTERLLRYNSSSRIYTGYSRGETTQVRLAAKSKPIPRIICFDQNYEETVSFLSALGEGLCASAIRVNEGVRLPPSQRTWHDFADIDYISPSAALVLAAEYDRGRILADNYRMFTINQDKWRPNVRQTLSDLGFFSLLGMEDPKKQIDFKANIVRFRSDSEVKMSIASDTFKDVIRLAANAAVLMVSEDLLANFRTVLQAIGEALTNTSDHAYPDNLATELPSVGRWWITGAVDIKTRRLTFTVYDQGVSIPRAIPHGRRFEKVQKFFRRLVGRDLDPDDTSLDSQSIASAVRAGASGTGLEHRGKGLGLMRSCIQTDRIGQLRIISRNGDYTACSNRKDQHRNRQVALRGTLVEWTVNL